MSANRPDNETPNTTTGTTGTGSTSTPGTGASVTGDPSQWGASATGGAGTGATDAGTTRDAGAGSLTRGTTTSTGGGTGAATAPATGIAGTARQYGEKIAEGASRAKDYVAEKASVVGEKFQDLRNKDYGQMAEDAKQYARTNPGQALLISAAAGFVLGLLLRGSRR